MNLVYREKFTSRSWNLLGSQPPSIVLLTMYLPIGVTCASLFAQRLVAESFPCSFIRVDAALQYEHSVYRRLCIMVYTIIIGNDAAFACMVCICGLPSSIGRRRIGI